VHTVVAFAMPKNIGMAARLFGLMAFRKESVN
jgi:hypothetical protein